MHSNFYSGSGSIVDYKRSLHAVTLLKFQFAMIYLYYVCIFDNPWCSYLSHLAQHLNDDWPQVMAAEFKIP